ncbi:hypothetical protein LCI18_012519 [Fusarium solani-melongenae]|uniref:Uncharacterized protein n=1 Tax=Fusarium solani subsp. cucurbitae TaxID=2747967 RepID=A0ACD3ZJX7_FUSSC|nr:hypothetical protein LCI18_012519 [Fusarium solani-melongenae]
MSRLFAPICLSLPESIPEVHAVTRLVIRRECRRQIIPPVLRLLLQKLPRLQTMVYEPWRACRRTWKIACDKGMLRYQLFDRRPIHLFAEFASVIQDALPSHVEMLSIFEDPNSELVSAMHRDPLFQQVIDDNMTAGAELVRALVLRSCDLKHLSIFFMVDARPFLDSLQSTHCCHKLRSLTLTASILKRESQSRRIASFLNDASSFPQEMKQLERLILCNSKRGEACAVIYQRDRSSQILEECRPRFNPPNRTRAATSSRQTKRRCHLPLRFARGGYRSNVCPAATTGSIRGRRGLMKGLLVGSSSISCSRVRSKKKKR